ncbi:MAG: TolB family protein, partial [Chitinophagales bacterium]
MNKWISFLLCLPVAIAQAQSPGFEIYLSYIGGNATQGYYFTEPENISRNTGYDNQPHFSNDGNSIIFASIRTGNQADIFQYSIPDRTIQQLTHTPESEFSPEFYASDKYISTVRVQLDSAQRLWSYKVKSGKFKPLLKNIYDVGYYCHINTNFIALFLLPEPFRLSIANVKERIMVEMDRNIGRSIKMIPQENSLVYVVKDDTAFNLIKK